MQKAALYTSAVIFAAGAIGHAVRLVRGFEIAVGGRTVPLWWSYLGVLVAGLLAIWMVVAARRS